MGRIFKWIFSIFLIMIMFLGILPIPEVKAAGNDISSLVATDLSLSSSQIMDGDKVTLHLKFAENGQYDIQGSDRIIVTWNAKDPGSIKGFSKTILLYIDCHHVGDGIVRENEMEIIFNDQINLLENVKGDISFEIQGRNLSNTDQEDTKTGLIKSGRREVEIAITKGETDISDVFYYKTGNMSTDDIDHANWWLIANYNKTYVDSDIKIEDQI